MLKLETESRRFKRIKDRTILISHVSAEVANIIIACKTQIELLWKSKKEFRKHVDKLTQGISEENK